jgi:hypothetical protein
VLNSSGRILISMEVQYPKDREPESDNQAKPIREKAGPDYWKKQRNPIWNYLIILLIIAVLAGTAYLLFLKPKPAADKQAPAPQAQSNGQFSAKTTHYDSANFTLGFDYPQNWTLTDTAGSGRLSVVSPAVSLKDANGQQVTGQIIMSIRDKTQKLTEFDKGNANATQDSEKIAYTNPTQTQRGSTYISFLQYASSSTGLDGIYVTGDSGYQKGQDIPLIDISKVDPVISITFLKCADSKCSGSGTPLSIDKSVWADASFSGSLKKMLQSLSIT